MTSIPSVNESNKTSHIDKRLVKSNLTAKLQDGNLSQADLKAAEKLAKQNGTTENRVLYASIKKQIENEEG